MRRNLRYQTPSVAPRTEAAKPALDVDGHADQHADAVLPPRVGQGERPTPRATVYPDQPTMALPSSRARGSTLSPRSRSSSDLGQRRRPRAGLGARNHWRAGRPGLGTGVRSSALMLRVERPSFLWLRAHLRATTSGAHTGTVTCSDPRISCQHNVPRGTTPQRRFWPTEGKNSQHNGISQHNSARMKTANGCPLAIQRIDGLLCFPVEPVATDSRPGPHPNLPLADERRPERQVELRASPNPSVHMASGTMPSQAATPARVSPDFSQKVLKRAVFVA